MLINPALCRFSVGQLSVKLDTIVDGNAKFNGWKWTVTVISDFFPCSRLTMPIIVGGEIKMKSKSIKLGRGKFYRVEKKVVNINVDGSCDKRYRYFLPRQILIIPGTKNDNNNKKKENNNLRKRVKFRLEKQTERRKKTWLFLIVGWKNWKRERENTCGTIK